MELVTTKKKENYNSKQDSAKSPSTIAEFSEVFSCGRLRATARSSAAAENKTTKAIT